MTSRETTGFLPRLAGDKLQGAWGRSPRDWLALAAIGAVAAAARAVGKSATAAYALRERARAESFAAAWDMAVQMAQDRAFEAALDRRLATRLPVDDDRR